MSLADIATIATIVSSAAVVISLIYMALQIKQAQRNQQALMQQTRTAGITDMNIALADPAIAAAYNKGLAGDPDMTPTEVRQFLSLARCGFINMENNYSQHLDGLMSDDAFSSALEGARFQATFPGLRAAWRLTSTQFGAEYAAFMDAIVSSTPHTAAVSPLSQWKQIVQSDDASRA